MNWKKPITSSLKSLSLSIALVCAGTYIAHAETLGEPEKEELKFCLLYTSPSPRD